MTIARMASDIALVVDDRGVIRTVAEGATPLPPSCNAWVGRAWVETVCADTRPKIELLLREVREEGVARRREVNHPLDDGQNLPVAWSAIRLGSNGPVIAMGRDLRAVAAIQQRFVDTQRELERAYSQKRQAQGRQRLLYQVAHDAVIVLDATTQKVIEANEAAVALVGVSLAALVGRGIPEVVPAPSRADLTQLLATVRSTGQAGATQLRMNEHDPSAGVWATPFRGSDRIRLVLRARHADPSDDALAAMADAVDETTDGVVIVDATSCVAMANVTFLRLAHVDDESEARGRPLADLMGEAAPAWAALLVRVSQHGLVARERLELAAAGRASESVEVTAMLLSEGVHDGIGVVVSARPGRLRRAGTPTQPLLSSLQSITAQVGQMPLAALLAEAERAAERHLILAAIERAAGAMPMAAQLLGLSPHELKQRMRRLGISPPVTRSNDAPTSIN